MLMNGGPKMHDFYCLIFIALEKEAISLSPRHFYVHTIKGMRN
jgi:hypothetical protein